MSRAEHESSAELWSQERTKLHKVGTIMMMLKVSVCYIRKFTTLSILVIL